LQPNVGYLIDIELRSPVRALNDDERSRKMPVFCLAQ